MDKNQLSFLYLGSSLRWMQKLINGIKIRASRGFILSKKYSQIFIMTKQIAAHRPLQI